MKTLIGILMVGLVIGCSGICLAEDVPILPDDPELLLALDEYAPGAITLVEGWNLIAVPVLPRSPLTVEKFIKMANSDGSQPGGTPPFIEATWKVLVVAVYKNGQFERYPKKGISYNMVPGEAYFVYAQYMGPWRPGSDRPTVTISIPGKPVHVSVSLHLNRGWNGVSLMRKKCRADGGYPIPAPPLITTDNQTDSDGKVKLDGIEERFIKLEIVGTLSQLSRELTEQGVKATRIAFWNSSTQEWEQYALPYLVDPPTVEPFPGIKIDRLISASEGFFLLCGENGLHIPGLCGRTEPVPPVPPDEPSPRVVVKEFQITNNQKCAPGSHHIYGDKIVWVDEDSGIYMYDISTGNKTLIANDVASPAFPAIYKDKIVWQEFRDGNNDIYMYDLSSGEKIQITNDPHNQYGAAIYGDKIVWTDGRNGIGNTDIYMYDISKGEEFQITTDPAEQFEPDVYENKIIWIDRRHGIEGEIYMYDTSTGIETQITNDPQGQFFPAIYKDRIVWTENVNGLSAVFVYDLKTGKKTQLTADPKGEVFPDIYEDKIVWEDYRNGDTDIYMYDLSTGTETQITNIWKNQMFPSIYKNRVIWSDMRNGYYDLYMAEVVILSNE